MTTPGMHAAPWPRLLQSADARGLAAVADPEEFARELDARVARVTARMTQLFTQAAERVERTARERERELAATCEALMEQLREATERQRELLERCSHLEGVLQAIEAERASGRDAAPMGKFVPGGLVGAPPAGAGASEEGAAEHPAAAWRVPSFRTALEQAAREDRERIPDLLRAAGLTVNDMRPSGGRVWVVGGSELRVLFAPLAAHGVRFLAVGSSSSTDDRPGWYTRDLAPKRTPRPAAGPAHGALEAARPDGAARVRVPHELVGIIGNGEFTSDEVLTRFWAYVRKHKLYEGSDQRLIRCDEQLRTLTEGRERVTFSELMAIFNQLMRGQS